jgi:hypothetical protein
MQRIGGWIFLSAALAAAAYAQEVVRKRTLAVEMHDGAPGPATRVKVLWVSTDDGQSWQRIQDRPEITLRGIVETTERVYARLTVPKDGPYAFAWQAGPSEEELHPDPPKPGQWPDRAARVIVDTSPQMPSVKLLHHELQERRVRIWFAAEAPTLPESLALWWTTDSGRTWNRAATTGGADARGTYAEAVLPAAGTYGLRLTMADAAGRRIEPPAAGAAPELDKVEVLEAVKPAAPPPSQEPPQQQAPPQEPPKQQPPVDPRVLIPAGGEVWTAGHSVLLKWVTLDPGARPRSARLEFRVGPEDPWRTLWEGRELTGFAFWLVPNVESRQVQLRVSVERADGQPMISSPSPNIEIRPAPPVNVAAALAEHDRATLLLSQQKTAEAVVHLEAALAHWHNYGRALSDLGVAYEGMGETERALPFYLDAVRADPSNPVYHYNVGRAMYRMRLLDPALAAWADAVRLMERPDPRLAVRLGESFVEAARAYQQASQPERAAEAAGWAARVPGVTAYHRSAAAAILEELKKP